VNSLSAALPPAVGNCMPASQSSLNLKNPGLAAFLAWLVPGLGHLYQGRILKGVLYFVTICGLFFFGSWLGSWRVVFLRWDNDEWRFSYLAQLAVGLPALPAAFDALEIRPAFARLVPPLAEYQSKPLTKSEREALSERLSVERGGSNEQMKTRLHQAGANYVITLDEVDELHRKYGVTMHIAAIYTLIAGLLNVLVIYDAAAGPAHLQEDEAEDEASRRAAEASA
jgi:TM2 domain-containing membrane protein YozV